MLGKGYPLGSILGDCLPDARNKDDSWRELMKMDIRNEIPVMDTRSDSEREDDENYTPRTETRSTASSFSERPSYALRDREFDRNLYSEADEAAHPPRPESAPKIQRSLQASPQRPSFGIRVQDTRSLSSRRPASTWQVKTIHTSSVCHMVPENVFSVSPTALPQRSIDIHDLQLSSVPDEVKQARLSTLRRVERTIQARFGEKYAIGLFGSTTYGTDSEDSDLDLVLFVSPYLRYLIRRLFTDLAGSRLRKRMGPWSSATCIQDAS